MSTPGSLEDPRDVPTREVVAALLKKAGATLECQLRGGSMGHTLPDGVLLRLHFEPAPTLAVGDVVAFTASDSITVHRIVGKGLFGPARSYLVTRGDGSVLTDHPVHVRSVVGIVREWKNGGTWQPVPPYLAAGWRSIAGRMIVVLVIGALHIQHRLAMAITIAGFTLQRATGFLRAHPRPDERHGNTGMRD